MDHSQIMHTLAYASGRYGPRLTGSPNFEADGVGFSRATWNRGILDTPDGSTNVRQDTYSLRSMKI